MIIKQESLKVLQSSWLLLYYLKTLPVLTLMNYDDINNCYLFFLFYECRNDSPAPFLKKKPTENLELQKLNSSSFCFAAVLHFWSSCLVWRQQMLLRASMRNIVIRNSVLLYVARYSESLWKSSLLHSLRHRSWKAQQAQRNGEQSHDSPPLTLSNRPSWMVEAQSCKRMEGNRGVNWWEWECR